MGLLAELIDLVLPTHCVCCRRPGPVWCADCRPDSGGEVVALAHGPPVHAAAEYAGDLRTALLSYKERGARGLAAPLADYLGDAVDLARRGHPGPGLPALVPVPSTRAAARRRGGDHVRRLGALVARQVRLELLPVLRLTGRVADSAGLSVAQRASNLDHRMLGLAGRCRGQPATGDHPGRHRHHRQHADRGAPGAAGGRLAGGGSGGHRLDPAPAAPIGHGLTSVELGRSAEFELAFE